jgi:Uma2 family endonuclease
MSRKVLHQSVLGNFHGVLFPHFHRSEHRLFILPFDVYLPNCEISVQPDLCVCDAKLLDKNGCHGAPVWIIEVLTGHAGKGAKEITQTNYNLYQKAGVREYWIVFSIYRVIMKFVLDENDVYQLKGIYAEDGIITPFLFPELEVDLTDVFESCDDDD